MTRRAPTAEADLFDGMSGESEPDALATSVPDRAPATGELIDQEQAAPAVGVSVGTGDSRLDVVVVVVGDSDSDAGEITGRGQPDGPVRDIARIRHQFR